jgi:hypothetical protein
VAEQSVNLPTAIYLGVFSRAEQRVLQAIFKGIAKGGGRCVATLAMLARGSQTNKSSARNAIAQAIAIGLLEKTESRSYRTVSLPKDPRAALVCTMTLQKAKSIARHLGLTLRLLHSGDFRVNFRKGDESTAYYTDTLEDAVNTAVEMARKRPSAP